MPNMLELTRVFGVILLLSGCSAAPAGFHRLHDLRFGEAGLYIYRAERSEEGAPTFSIVVDNGQRGSLPSDAYLALVVPSGARTVQAGLGDGGIFSKETMIKTTLVVDDLRHYFLQVVPVPQSGAGSSSGTVPRAYFTLTPEATAIEELKRLRRLR